MECPRCHTPMTKGFVTVTAGAFGYLLTAFTKPYCIFYPETGGERETRVVEAGKDYKLAYRCAQCRLVVIEDRLYNPNYPLPPGFIEVKAGEDEEGIHT